jgi:hypothetical protein
MVGDDEIHAELSSAARGIGTADAAIDRDDNVNAFRVKSIQGRRLQAISVAQPFGDEVHDVATEELERPT